MIETSAYTGVSPFFTFSPSSTDLGGTFSNTSSQLSFSFEYAEVGSTSGATTSLLRLSFGNSGTPTTQIEFLSNGTIDFETNNGSPTTGYVTSNGSASTSSSNGNDLIVGNSVWATLSGTLNYATDTYTLSVNGVAQQFSTYGTNIPFANTTPADMTSALNLRDFYSSTSLVPTALDNISVALVPEPGIESLLFPAAGIFLAMALTDLRRRRKSLA